MIRFTGYGFIAEKPRVGQLGPIFSTFAGTNDLDCVFDKLSSSEAVLFRARQSPSSLSQVNSVDLALAVLRRRAINAS